jgi:hypothetical protein
LHDDDDDGDGDGDGVLALGIEAMERRKRQGRDEM